MMRNLNFSYLAIVILLFLSNFNLYGQEIINNNQTETLKLPLHKVVSYFNDFKHSSLLDYGLKETKVDSISRKENSAIIYLTENKNYGSATIFTNLKLYQKTIKDKSFESNIIMLYKGEYNSEVLKHPIKPVIRESFSKNGVLKWKIMLEKVDENSTKLVFVFDSFNEKFKQDFISKFSKEVDNYFNYKILKIYLSERFKLDILKYLEKSFKSDASGVQPTR